VLQSPEALVQTRAMEIAQAYLDEVMTKRFDENSGQGGVPRCDSTDTGAQPCSATLGADDPPEDERRKYDDVDDYHGLSHSPPQLLSAGTALDGYGGYGVTVEVVLAGSELGYADNGRRVGDHAPG
jgi:MSHA pilin protein MshD